MTIGTRTRWLTVCAGGQRWRINADFAGIDFVGRLGAGTFFKQNPRTRVAKLRLPELPETPLIVKEYLPARGWRAWKERCRRSPALRAWRRVRWLEQLGVDGATLVAAGGMYTVWVEIPDVQTLGDLNGACADRRVRRQLISDLARVMARLHAAGLSHGDPSLNNFLVQTLPGGGRRLVMIDPDGLRWAWWRTDGDLEELAHRARVSRREELRFLVEYRRQMAQIG